jgi:hypothetical protein
MGLAEQTLLSGIFTGNASGSTASEFQSATGIGTDTKSLELLEVLGIDSTATWQFSFSMFELIGSTRVTNTSSDEQPTPVPEPASLILLGSGIAAFARHRRKLKRKAP